MSALQDEPPAPGASTPDVPGGLGMRALRNTILILVARVISRIIALVAVIIIGNYLDPTRFGEMQTAVTYVGLVGTVTDLGFSALYVREGARHTDQIARYWNNVASLKVVGAVIGLPLIFAALSIAGVRSLLWPSFAILVLSGYQLLLRNTLYAMQRLTFEIIEIVPETLVVFALVVIGVHINADTGFFLWAYAISYAFACVYFGTVLMLMGVLRPGLQLEPGLLFSWVKVAVPLGITFIITTVYFKVDVPILQRFRPYSEVGYYTFAYKPFESLLFIPFALRSVVFPVLSVYHRRSPERVLPLAEKFFKALVILGWPITVGVFLLAPQFNSLLHLYAGVGARAADPRAGDRVHVRRQHLRRDAQRHRQAERVCLCRHGGARDQRWRQPCRDPALWLPGRQLGGGCHRGGAGRGRMVRAPRAARDDPACDHLVEGDRGGPGHGRLHLRGQPASEPGAAVRHHRGVGSHLRCGTARAPRGRIARR